MEDPEMEKKDNDLNLDIPISIIFSTLLPAPSITFQYSNTDGFVVLPEIPTQQLKVTVHTESTALALDLPCGTHSLSFCDKLLSDLMRQRDLFCFKQPVDPIKDNAPNYLDVIKNPMDLTTLQRNLKLGKITSVNDFKNKLDSVWNNCITFNGPEHPLTTLAKNIKKAVQHVWDTSIIPTECESLSKLQEMNSALNDLEKTFNKVFSLSPPPDFGLPPEPVIRLIEEKHEEEKPLQPIDQPPNHKERQSMVEILTTTPPNEIIEAWNILHPYLTQDIIKNGVFSLNSIPNPVLIELKKLLLQS